MNFKCSHFFCSAFFFVLLQMAATHRCVMVGMCIGCHDNENEIYIRYAIVSGTVLYVLRAVQFDSHAIVKWTTHSIHIIIQLVCNMVLYVIVNYGAPFACVCVVLRKNSKFFVSLSVFLPFRFNFQLEKKSKMFFIRYRNLCLVCTLFFRFFFKTIIYI